MNFRIFHSFAVCFVCLAIGITSASAHSGGLDSQGGHYNRKTGEYHYHRGSGAGDVKKAISAEKKSERKTKTLKSDSSEKKKSKRR